MKNKTKILISGIIAVFFLIPALHVNAAIPNPYNRWGQAYVGGSLAPQGSNITAWIDGTPYEVAQVMNANGDFDSNCIGNDTATATKDGGDTNDLVIYMYDFDLFHVTHIANEVGSFVSGNTPSKQDLNFVTANQPKFLKINELVVTPSSGNDYVFIYNPTATALTDYQLEDNDAWSLSLGSGGTQVGDCTYFDLAGDILSSAGDELKLVWTNPTSTIAAGNDVVIDRVEYGNQSAGPDNTSLKDAPTPGTGQSIKRTPTNGKDTDNCWNDFAVGTATPRPVTGAAPVLAWVGSGAYTTDGLDPETGDVDVTNFVYKIKYSDADGNSPNYVKVNIYSDAGGTTPIAGSPFTMVHDSWVGPANNWVQGEILSYTTKITAAGTDYTYKFTAQDSTGADATPTALKNAPDVSGGVPPSHEPKNVTASKVGTTDINLTWDQVSDANSYNVYRSNYVNGSGPWESIGTTSNLFFVAAGNLSDSNNYSYVVKSKNAGGENATASNIAFKLCYQLYVGAGVGGDLNFVSLPYNFSIGSGATYNTMRGLRNDIGASSVKRWEQDSGTWTTVGAFGTDYPLEPGKSYSVVVASSILYKMVGAYRNITLSLYVGAGVGGDQNFVSLPYHCNVGSGATYNTMRGLRNSIGASSVKRWEQDSGTWTTVGAFGTNYPLEWGKGYTVVVASSIDWVCPVKEVT